MARPTTPRSLRGDIEGLRAIAVLMVLLYHAGVPGLSGGFAGVDVFFVISGYLITGLLVREAVRDGRIDVRQFYARRARRLLPAASLVIVVSALAGWWILPRSSRSELGADVFGSTFYVVNWVLSSREVDYLAEDAAPSLLQHYWSLSVEEQFYVVWPVLVISVLWLAQRTQLPFQPMLRSTLFLLVGGSIVWSVLRTAEMPATAYFTTTTRAWQLGVGGLLVLLTPRLVQLGGRIASLLAWGGLAAIGATLVLVSESTPWPGSAALLPTLGTAAVIAGGLASPHNSIARSLSRPPMLFLGALSYGLYLWHWPALRLLMELDPEAQLPARLAACGLSILLAWATLHLVENPIRFHRGLSLRPWRTLTLGATIMVITGLLGAGLVPAEPQFDAGRRDQVLNVEAVPLAHGDSTVIDGAGAIGLVSPASRTGAQLEPVGDPTVLLTRSGAIFPHPELATQDSPGTTFDLGDCCTNR